MCMFVLCYLFSMIDAFIHSFHKLYVCLLFFVRFLLLYMCAIIRADLPLCFAQHNFVSLFFVLSSDILKEKKITGIILCCFNVSMCDLIDWNRLDFMAFSSQRRRQEMTVISQIVKDATHSAFVENVIKTSAHACDSGRKYKWHRSGPNRITRRVIVCHEQWVF